MTVKAAHPNRELPRALRQQSMTMELVGFLPPQLECYRNTPDTGFDKFPGVEQRDEVLKVASFKLKHWYGQVCAVYFANKENFSQIGPGTLEIKYKGAP